MEPDGALRENKGLLPALERLPPRLQFATYRKKVA
jgi:hypothetical protein